MVGLQAKAWPQNYFPGAGAAMNIFTLFQLYVSSDLRPAKSELAKKVSRRTAVYSRARSIKYIK